MPATNEVAAAPPPTDIPKEERSPTACATTIYPPKFPSVPI